MKRVEISPARTLLTLLALVLAFAARGADTPAPSKDGKATNQPPFGSKALEEALHNPKGWFETIKLRMTAKELGLNQDPFKKRGKRMSGAELLSVIQGTEDPKLKSLTIQTKEVYWYWRWQGPWSNQRIHIIFSGDSFDESVVIFTRMHTVTEF